MKPEDILEKYFGFEEFRPLQKDIINAVLSKKDVLAIMPTGGGKSLCYQVPAMIFSGLTIVISPLIALMQDQVSYLQQLGISALFLNSSLDWDSYKQNMNEIRQNRTKILFLAPESISSQRVLSLISEMQVDLIAIDEAHCISQWGHDFRPEYREIGFLRNHFPKAVILALTATATVQVRKDILSNLNMKNKEVFVSGFNRKNIFLEVAPKKNPVLQLLSFIYKRKNEAGIVYCFSRKQVDELTKILVDKGFNAASYHAGLSDTYRGKILQDFLQDKVKIVVATVAFGMGIDKGNVSYVVHYDLPKSLEQYYQEIGRSGRNGKPAHALLLYSGSDAHKISYFIQDKEGHNRIIAEEQLNGVVKYCKENLCRRKALLSYFGEVYNDSSSYCCDVCNGKKSTLNIDISETGRLFLQLILQTGEKYGVTYLINILMGEIDNRIKENRHHKLCLWNVGSNLSRQQWFSVCEYLLELGLIKKINKYNVLALTTEGKFVLKSKEPIVMEV